VTAVAIRTQRRRTVVYENIEFYFPYVLYLNGVEKDYNFILTTTTLPTENYVSGPT
jgi:hypothetical protein